MWKKKSSRGGRHRGQTTTAAVAVDIDREETTTTATEKYTEHNLPPPPVSGVKDTVQTSIGLLETGFHDPPGEGEAEKPWGVFVGVLT